MGIRDKLSELAKKAREFAERAKQATHDPRVEKFRRETAPRIVKRVQATSHKWFGTHPMWAGNMPVFAWYAPIPPRERTFLGTTFVFWRGNPSTPGARLYLKEQRLKAKILQERVEEFEKKNPIVADMAQFLHPLAKPSAPQKKAPREKKKRKKKKKRKYPHTRWA